MIAFVEGVEGRVEGDVEGVTSAIIEMLRVLRVTRTRMCASVLRNFLINVLLSRTENTFNTLNTFNIKKESNKKQVVTVKKMLRVAISDLQHPQHGVF
ncbi:MAG: hypothetical protein P4L87_25135 [Formivibrio sp.]|nr:hypothetical protein [Formivibrio sp.]